MASELGGTGLNGSQKENDDISLPFWIFLWSFLAIAAGFIYSKLNRQKEIESELKSGGKPNINDEQIARKLVNEIARKDSGRKSIFRRQRSYEIIDGEVRIHYDVSMVEDSLYKSANIEGLLKTAEVESIPIRSTSLDDLEFVYPGKLPSIVEEGDEDLEDQSEEQTPLTSINEGRPDAQIDFHETKGKETQINTTKIHNISNSNENTCNVEGNGLHFEEKQGEFPTSFETITQETLIPAESINDANKITIDPQKGNCVSLKHETETELKEIENEMNLNENSDGDESSSISGDSVIENVSAMSDVTNSSHNSNNTTTSVYKLTQVEKTHEHKFTVTRREITKLKSSEEKSLNSDSFKDETSFPFVKTKGREKTGETGDDCSQLSRDLQSDNLVPQQGIQSCLHSDDNIEKSDSLLHEKGSENEQLDCGTIVATEVEDFDQKEETLSDETFQESSNEVCNDYSNRQFGQQKSPKHEDVVKELSSGGVYKWPDTSLDPNEAIVKLSDEDVNECPDTSLVPDECCKEVDEGPGSSLQEPRVLTFLEDSCDILVDNSGDILFKVTGPSTDDAYFGDMVENYEQMCEKNNSGELTIDENQNVDRFGGKNELVKNWNSLPSWEGVHSIKHCELNSDSSDVGYVDLDKNIVDDTEGDNSGVDHAQSLEDKNNDLKQKNLGIVNEEFSMQNGEVFNEDIKEANLLTFENKIRSRKTIFVKDAAKPVYTRNDESEESFIVKTGFDISTGTTAVKGDGEVTAFGELENENTKPDTLECEIPDEIIVAVQTHEVEAECPIPGQADTASDEPVFATASVTEEYVLMAKIITDSEPSEVNLDLSTSGKTTQPSCQTILTNSETIHELSEQNCATNLGEAEINKVTNENIPASPGQSCTCACSAYTNTDVANKENNVYPGVLNGDFKPSAKTQTTTIRTTLTETQITQTKVHSMVNASIQTKNGDIDPDNDKTTVVNKSHEQTAVESSISQNIMPKESELVDHGRISEQAIVSTTLDENEEARLSDNNADLVVDDSQISELVLIPDFIVETKPDPPNEPHINSDSIDFVENIPTNFASMDELESLPYIAIKNDEEFVIYANQVTEVTASDDESCAIGETVEAIHSRPVDDYSPIVVYASQISDSESTPETYCKDESELKQPNDNFSCGLDKRNKDNGSTTVVYADILSSDTKGTTVIYASQDGDIEVVSQPILETTNQSQTKSITPNHIAEEDRISNQETSDMDLPKPTPISPQPNDESRNFRETSFDATPLTSSPVTNMSSADIQEDNLNNVKIPSSPSTDPLTNNSLPEINEEIFAFGKISSSAINDPVTNPPEVQQNILSSDILPPSSCPLPELNESPSELWQNLPLGETDVDNLSDIDEIDIDIPPDENYQKSKSVTDLDEALASFGGLDYLSNDADTMTGSLSKSVPDILDSCREESLRETVANPIEKLQKKNLSLSTPEINSKPGSKKVTKIKIIHVKFLEMQSDSENVEEDSFIYEGDFPITVKMKRKSRNLSEEFSSPVASPPFSSPVASPDLSREIAQERWIADKTNLKQLEFEFGDLFQNSPSPPPLEANDIKGESSTDGLNQGTRYDTRKDAAKFQDASMAYSLPDNLSYKTTDKPFNTSNSSKSTPEYQDPTLPDSTQRPSLTDVNMQSFRTFNGSTASRTGTSRFEAQSQRSISRESTSSTYKTSTATQSSTRITCESKLKSYIERSSEDVILASPSETKVASSTEKLHQTSNIIHSRTMLSSDTKSKVEYKNIQDIRTSMTSETEPQTPKNQDIPSKTSERVSQSPTTTDSASYRYTPGNSRSYSKVPKPSPEHGRYVVKTGTISAQSTSKETKTRNITPQARYTDSANSPRNIAQFTERPNSAKHIATQARYIDSPHSASPSSSPRHGIKLSEKFHMSDEGSLAQNPPGDQIDGRMSATNQTDGHMVPTNPCDGQKTSKSNQRGSNDKGASRHGGKLVTVKSGIINDYECSSDADSEMSYHVPSPRIKAKRFHRPQVHRVDSASSSEPDSPRRQVKSDRRSMSELFGVGEGSQYSSDTSKEMGSQNSLRNQTLFARFGNVGHGEETRQNETFVESNPSPSFVYQARPTIFDPRPIQPGPDEIRGSNQPHREQGVRNPNPRYSNAPERNPGPPNVYQAKVTTFDQRSTDTKTYSNPRHTNALERNLSPTNFLQEGNLGSDDHMSPKTMEFNPFEDIEGRDGFQPFERCHSPSSVYSDTSSVFSFSCDFDPMPPPSGKYEPEVYTCENPMCKKQDILLGPEKTSFKSCPACFTYYCSSECRKLHWPSHKQSCYFGRVNTYVRSIIRLCQRREDLSMYLSQLARDGYKKKGRGVVMAIFNNPELAREFITKGHDAFSGRKPTYSSLPELHREGIISKHRVALMQAVRDYEPNQEFVFNIAVVAAINIPIVPAPRYKLNTVLHCIKMPLNDLIVARQPKDYEKVATRLFALPKCSRHEFVNEMEARRHYCRNLSKNLRQYNVKLKEDYPECYKKLCMYVEHNIPFEPMTVYGQRGGLSYKCVIAPEQSYPLNAEYC